MDYQSDRGEGSAAGMDGQGPSQRITRDNVLSDEVRSRGYDHSVAQGDGLSIILNQGQRNRKRTYKEMDTTEQWNGRRRESRKRTRSTGRGSRKRRSRSSSSADSESPVLPSPGKRRKHRNLDTNKVLDKFMQILHDVKSSDRPRITFNTNNVIPEFDPMSKEQTMLNWINKVEECAEIYSWEDKEIIHYALPKLSGVAKTWYQGLPSLLFSWPEWKKKLIESFPVRENYAELLTEMLQKKVKYGESLEQYFYAKMNLLNRCHIRGKQAVDCLLYGIDDRTVKIGAQAAEFKEPEQVLKYFRTIKVAQSQQGSEMSKSKFDRKNTFYSKSGTTRTINNSIRCFNCNEIGHPSFRCSKTLVKCTDCERIGHLAENCFKKNKPTNMQEATKNRDKNEKQIAELSVTDSTNNKYLMDIKINDNGVPCHMDLGSQCSLICLTKAMELNLDIKKDDNMPVLRGIGAKLITPLGRVVVSVVVQDVMETIEMYVVNDYVITRPVLLGHSFTEKPDIVITKTPTEVLIQKIPTKKTQLQVNTTISVPINALRAISVNSEPVVNGTIYVTGSVRGPEGKEYYLIPGEYDIRNGRGAILACNVSTAESITFEKGSLLTRVLYKDILTQAHVTDVSSVSFSVTEKDESVTCGPTITNDERMELQKLLARYGDCFSSGLKDLGFTNVGEIVIDLIDNEPVVYRPYRLSFSERALVRGMVQEMIDCDIVKETSSPYASPIVLVQKKTGEKRMCVDYRALNRKTKKDHYPLPRVEDQLDLLAGNILFTSLDLASGYYQIPVSKESRQKTAFVTPDGQFEYNRMPFGLVNAPSVFQRTINKILSDAKIKYAIVYMDDILIPSRSFQEGIQRLEEVLALLREGGLTLKLGKCNFFQNNIDFLGFEVSAEGIKPGTKKTDAVSQFPTPRNVHELRQFLGLSGFFRRFIKDYALITTPLTELLKKDVAWLWNEKQEQAFNRIKNLLVERPLLALYDPEAETQLHTDASKDGLAGILLQVNKNGGLQPVSYFSRKTTNDEKKLHSFELETLAVISALNRFRVYLIGKPFKILTDCNALRSTLTKRDLIPRIARWWVQFQEYNCSIEYRPGVRMAHADALSRHPVEPPTIEPHVLDVLAIQGNEEEWITTVQSSDDEVRRIKEALKYPGSNDKTDITKTYKLKNDRVYRVVGNEIKWVVPRGVRWQILKMNHDDVGHYGFEKTLHRIQQRYWFAKMRRFVKKYVSSCLECAHHKTPGGRREGQLHPIEKLSIPFHTIHIDHLGPFIKSKSGNTYLLVLVDGFTKFVNAKPVKNTKSATTIKVLKEHMAYFGVPTRLISDKGSCFTSKLFKDFVTSYGMKHIINAVATPRANGQVERFNRTILDALSTSSHGENDKTWDEYIPDIQVGINTTVHKTTQKSPSELLFGFNITGKSEGIMSTIINDTLQISTTKDLEEARKDARDKMSKQQDKDVERFNSRRKDSKEYCEGDLVRVERQVPHDGRSQKLVVKYQGPYRIVKLLPNERFVIEDTPLSRKNGRKYEAIVSIDKIQPWLVFDRNFDSDTDTNENESDSQG